MHTQGVEPRIIPADDRREKLRGSLGLYATEDLPAAYVVGVYGEWGCICNNWFASIFCCWRGLWLGLLLTALTTAVSSRGPASNLC